MDGLAQADESMADKFFRLRQELSGGQLQRLSGMQAGWLAARMTCGRDYPCIDKNVRVSQCAAS